mgnify:CR=1 FL=1
MNDYGSSSSRGRAVLKSPNPHLAEDPKTLRRKYEQAKEALRAEKKNSEGLEVTVRTLREVGAKQEKELAKKEEQIEILLEQIKYLKNVIAESKSKKSSKEISSYEEGATSKSTHSEEGPVRGPAVGGYFGSIFN